MADNEKSLKQRMKILYLYKILTEQTDEEHSISMPEIIEKLESCGISAGRKALYEDIEALRKFGVDIISGRGGNSGYAVVSRQFELPELKLLADAVCSSRFLTEKKAQSLLAKLGTLASVHEAKQLRRQVYIAGRTKEENELIYISVDAIQRAINEKKQISFAYYTYDLRKKRVSKGGSRVCTPLALLWSEERYYLVAHYDKYADKLTNFRVDRMRDVKVLEKPAETPNEEFDPEVYQNATFSMFSGKPQTVRLRMHNTLINPVIDRFGRSIAIHPDGSEHFIIQVLVRTEQPMPFFGWLFQFGTKAELLSPEPLREAYRQALEELMEAHSQTKNS